MRFSEILNRLTGISCPVFGISWNPVDTERSIARRIIIFLEPRRGYIRHTNMSLYVLVLHQLQK